MLPRFEQFIRERTYLKNVTASTVQWYRASLKWLPSEMPTQADLNDAVILMRNTRKASGCNCALRAINAYLKWSGSLLKQPMLKEPRLILPTFSDVQVKKIIAWRPQGHYQRRLHLLVLLLLDTGARISEAIGLHVHDVDLDNLLLLLDGKGRRQRLVPCSFALRKVLFRYIAEASHDLLFCTRSGTALDRDGARRAVKRLCRALGFDPPVRTLHALRHTFAVNYVRAGGSVFHLQKVLGHSSLAMTKRYVDLATADLSAVHERISLLNR